MMFVFKVDVIKKLREVGYNTFRIRQEKLIGEQTLRDIKSGKVPGIKTLEILCKTLNMQLGELIELEKDEE